MRVRPPSKAIALIHAETLHEWAHQRQPPLPSVSDYNEQQDLQHWQQCPQEGAQAGAAASMGAQATVDGLAEVEVGAAAIAPRDAALTDAWPPAARPIAVAGLPTQWEQAPLPPARRRS